MAKQSRGERDWIYLRGGVWWLKWRWPKDTMDSRPKVKPLTLRDGSVFPLKRNARRIEHSLHTSSKAEARELARIEIGECLQVVHHWRAIVKNTIVRKPGWRQQPGTMVTLPDGKFATANETTISIFENGKLVGNEHNGYIDRRIIEFPIPLKDQAVVAFSKSAGARDIDKDILDHWATTGNRRRGVQSQALIRDASLVLDTFHKTSGKTLCTAERDDAIALAKHLFEFGDGKRANKSATVQKRVGLLRSMVNHALLDHRRFPMLKRNAFSGRSIVVKREDAIKKVWLNDRDMESMRPLITALPSKRGIDDRKFELRLCWTILASTGMRLSEAFQIREEQLDESHRCIFVGRKSKSSERWLPLPPPVLELLPHTINGPLFTKLKCKNMGRALNRLMEKAAIKSKTKTLHCLRDRASWRLRGVQDSMRHRCLGHNDRTKPSEKYGGFSMVHIAKALEMVWLDATYFDGRDINS